MDKLLEDILAALVNSDGTVNIIVVNQDSAADDTADEQEKEVMPSGPDTGPYDIFVSGGAGGGAAPALDGILQGPLTP